MQPRPFYKKLEDPQEDSPELQLPQSSETTEKEVLRMHFHAWARVAEIGYPYHYSRQAELFSSSPSHSTENTGNLGRETGELQFGSEVSGQIPSPSK